MTLREIVKRIWHDPVWSKVIAGAVIALFTGLIGNNLGVWPAVKSYFWSIIDFELRRASIPNGIIIIGVIPLVFSLYVIAKILRFWRQSEDWHDYTSDEYENLRWVWKWSSSEDYKISELKIFCPSCRLEIHGSPNEGFPNEAQYYCDNCRKALRLIGKSPQDVADQAIREFERRARTGIGRESRPGRSPGRTR